MSVSSLVSDKVLAEKTTKNRAPGALLVGGGLTGASLATSQPANAQTPVDDINGMITSLDGIATTGLGIAIGVFTVWFGFRIVKKVMP